MNLCDSVTLCLILKKLNVMKKIIVSLDHVVGALMAAYEREMGIKSMDCCTERDGRIVVRFSVERIQRGQLDKLEATKWLKACGCELRYQGMVSRVVLSVKLPYELMLLSGVIFVKLTEKEFCNFFCAVAKTAMKAWPVVTLEGIRYNERTVVARVEVRYVSGMTPEGVCVSTELNRIASLFNGYADGFEEDQFGGMARIELTLDSEDVESTD